MQAILTSSTPVLPSSSPDELGSSSSPEERVPGLFPRRLYDSYVSNCTLETLTISSEADAIFHNNAVRYIFKEISTFVKKDKYYAEWTFSSIGDLEKITKLSINSVKLNNLPRSIGYLKHLVSISLVGNELQDLPPQFRFLTALKLLILDANQFTSLPDVLNQMTQPVMVHLRHNPLPRIDRTLLPLNITLHTNNQ